MAENKRKPNIFEKLVLFVGIMVLIIGALMINNTFNLYEHQISWDFLQTVFLWLVMVIFIILLAIGEDIKQSLMINQTEQLKNLSLAIEKLAKKNK